MIKHIAPLCGLTFYRPLKNVGEEASVRPGRPHKNSRNVAQRSNSRRLARRANEVSQKALRPHSGLLAVNEHF